MRNEPERTVDHAMSSARSVVGSAMRTAEAVREVGDACPETADRMATVASQMYAVAEIARDAEHELARIHAQVRR